MRILCYGDSLTAGYISGSPITGVYAPYGPILSQHLKVQCDSVGMSGWTTLQMCTHLTAEFAKDVCGELHPGLKVLLTRQSYTHVLLMAGTNDLGHRAADDIFASLRTLHEACHEAGAFTVALSIPQSMASVLGPSQVNSRRVAVNSLLEKYSFDNPQRCMYIAMDKDVPWSEESKNYESDGLHLSAEGYESFARLLAPKLLPLMGRPS
mmetsp:Transcript_33273/g.73068  ORF Transcript_33273/g.73068 Transcript_33273/m.73068 type:complete len:209 (-) Transcript_33273:428-1054(-)